MTDDDLARETLLRWKARPDLMVREEFGAEPDPWQDEILRAFPHRDRLLMKACKGPGKGHPLTMRFDTPRGLRQWGDLVVGDEVFGADGSPCCVRAIYDRGVLPLYRVVFDDGVAVEVDGDHLWMVQGRTERRHARWAALSTEEIVRRGVRERNGPWQGRQFAIPTQGPAQFARAEVPLDPYVLGVWLGDGNKGCGRFSGRDAFIDAELLRRGYAISPKDAAGITATIYGISDRLRSLGVFMLGSHERFVPERYRFVAIDQRLAVLRGLMDTDGTIGKDGHCEFVVTSRRLAEDVAWLTRSLGGVASWKKPKQGWYPRDGVRQKCRLAYRVTVTMPVCPFLTPRKVTRWSPRMTRDTQRYLTRYIDHIEPITAAPVRCIEVDHPSACYLANDFVVTHNTTVLAWLGWNFLGTRPHPRIGATSITGANLDSALMPELAKWQARSPFFRNTFQWSKTQIVHRRHPATWFLQARNWPKKADAQQQADALGGLHEDYAMWLCDEMGEYPQSLMATFEAVLSSGIECKIVGAGNPTNTTGPLHRACTTDRQLWFVQAITGDPDNPKAWVHSPRAMNRPEGQLSPLKHAQQQIAQYGRDNPWVMVNILGEFPPSSINALLSVEEVEAAMARKLRGDTYDWAQKRLGVDVARFGDDRTVIFPRQGLAAFMPIVMRNQPTTNIAARVAQAAGRWMPEGDGLILVDDTGHWGHGVIDNLITAAVPGVLPVFFNGKAMNPRYKNRRAEMWIQGAKCIQNGGGLPNLPELVGELVAATYTFVGGQFMLEDKDLIKEKIGRSPDLADGYMLTHALDDMPGGMLDVLQRTTTVKRDADPYEMPAHAERDFDPNEWKER